MMTLAQPPEIEPLSAEAWERVENGVFSALDRATPAAAPAAPQPAGGRARVLLAFVAVAAAAAIILALTRPDPQPAGDGALTRIETADAPAEVFIAGSKIVVDSHSAALYGNYGGSVQLVLERGGAHCEVTRRSGEDRFVVLAGDVEVRVVGTIFSVRREEREVSVDVERGQVEVCWRGACTPLGPGGQWPVPAVATALPKPAAVAPNPPEPRVKKRKPVRRGNQWESKYKKAHRLETSNPQRAVALYLEIINGANRKWAALSVYALGQFYAGKKDKRRAKKWFKRYLKDYPNGPNRGDVMFDLQAL